MQPETINFKQFITAYETNLPFAPWSHDGNDSHRTESDAQLLHRRSHNGRENWSYKATYENFYDADGNLEKRNVYDSGEWTSIQYYTWGERTAIQSVKGSAASSAPWFDLNGRRLDNQPTKKGLFIRNGKKVLIK